MLLMSLIRAAVSARRSSAFPVRYAMGKSIAAEHSCSKALRKLRLTGAERPGIAVSTTKSVMMSGTEMTSSWGESNCSLAESSTILSVLSLAAKESIGELFRGRNLSQNSLPNSAAVHNIPAGLSGGRHV